MTKLPAWHRNATAPKAPKTKAAPPAWKKERPRNPNRLSDLPIYDEYEPPARFRCIEDPSAGLLRMIGAKQRLMNGPQMIEDDGDE